MVFNSAGKAPGVYVIEKPSEVQAIAGVGTSTAGFVGVVGDQIEVPNPDFDSSKPESGDNPRLITVEIPTQVGEVKLCTNRAEYIKFFGGFPTDPTQRHLAHAVAGFFNNGGTRCYVVRVAAEEDIDEAFLTRTFEAIDEIAIVAAPGITNEIVRSAIDIHCRNTDDRFAIYDGPETLEDAQGNLDLLQFAQPDVRPPNTVNGAFYFPWIEVFDPATKEKIFVPPSGHMAGIYARVDNNRGVFKAPGNETVLGALGLKYLISKNQQGGLNDQAINCIRDLNGNIRIWGARTLSDLTEWRYINVRRTFLFIKESIDEGVQWAVFEPNDPKLWAKITRNVTAFLTTLWRDGALFGNIAQEAFYVKCNAETNPPELRELGQVVTEIGVAIVRPAEFVVFYISQWSGPPEQS